MSQAKIQFTKATLDRYQFLFFTSSKQTFISEYFRFIRFAILVDMLANRHVRWYSSRCWYRFTAQWTCGHLNILFMRWWTFMLLVWKMLWTDYVYFHFDNIQIAVSIHFPWFTQIMQMKTKNKRKLPLVKSFNWPIINKQQKKNE